MPQMHFTERKVFELPLADKTTWYSDSRTHKFPGLRLHVGKTAKTWYLSKRSPVTGKVQSIKLGRFPAMSLDKAAKEAAIMGSKIDNGQYDNEMPTLKQMLDIYIQQQMSDGELSARSAADYRDVMRLHAGRWLELPMDKIRAKDVTTTLTELKATRPYAATKAAIVIGALFRMAGDFDIDVKLPTKRFKLAPMKQRQVETSGSWAPRLDEIMAVDNPVKRMAWIALWHTGIRTGNLRALTWEDVDLDEGAIYLRRMKNGLSRTLPMSDVALAAFKRLKGLHPKWCFPSVRKGVHIDHLDALPSSTQHEMRHLFTTAAGLCHLPSYTIAFLKGDVLRADDYAMVAHYFHDLGDRAASNRISQKIAEKCGLTPSTLLESIGTPT